MRALAAAALALAVALPSVAQRGGGHASFSGHSAPAARSAPAFHGSFAPHSNFAPRPAYRFNAAPLNRPPIAYPSRMRIVPSPVHYPVAPPVRRPIFYQPNHGGINTTHRFIIRSYPYLNFGYYPGAIYFPYDSFFDDSYDNYDMTQQPAPAPDSSYNYPDNNFAYAQPAPEPDSSYAYPQPGPVSPYIYPAPGYSPYASQPAPTEPQMQYVPGSEDTVTLIYKDGRPPEQIQNYLATRTTLTILDNGRRREVPLADLDIPATMSANRQTGVDFELPTSH